MMMKHIFSLLVMLAALAPSIGLGGLIGEPAPPLVVKEWIKGQPVAVKPGTNIYVVEIWQSSIPACRAAITNLNDLQERFKTNGVVIVGIADESVEKIKEFVLHDGTNIKYAIAADDQRKTALSYMTPVKQRGIPYTFVVGTNGNVLWHGHPLAGLNQALEQITTGQYDLEPFRKSEVAAHQMEQYLGLAQQGDIRAKSAGQTLLANRTNDVELLCDMAYQITAAPRLAHRDFALAGEALDQAEKLAVTNKVPVMTIRAVCLFESGKRSEGLALATQALASAQSPQAKAKVQMFLQVMEARLAAAQTNQSNTNQVKAVPAAEPVSGVNTNQSNAIQGKGSAGKP
jgi:thiol-disulfide isomerase/thioredoxin